MKKSKQQKNDFLEEGEEIINEENITAEMVIMEEIIEEEIIIESYSVSETINELPKVAVEPKPSKYFDPKKSFEKNLKDFFEKNRRSKLKFVSAIAEKFKGQEEEVMQYLYYKYVTRVGAIINRQKAPSFNSFLSSN